MCYFSDKNPDCQWCVNLKDNIYYGFSAGSVEFDV